MERWIAGRYLYVLAIDPDINLLRIRTAQELDDFTRRYAIGYHGIDWTVIAEEYDGIEIAPYQWSRRSDTHTSWYYGWDCASGCLWTPRRSTLTLVGQLDATGKPLKSGPVHT